ncbi:XapX domain-containing protein [Silvibacterium bohemicum]
MIGVVVSFIVGAGCRYFDIPVPSPPVIPGALLVLAMTIGYSATNKFLNRKGEFASTSHLCGGPTGISVRNAKTDCHPNIAGGDTRPDIATNATDVR